MLENEEESINNLEINVDCLKDICDNFKNKENPSFLEREEVKNKNKISVFQRIY
jgi:hypothetical protein